MARNDYSRFYALLKTNPQLDKEEIVSQFTDGRTVHLHEMSRMEFNDMCDMLQYGSPTEQAIQEKKLRQARSNALLRIGRLGINTVDNWSGIDAFCLSPRIAGKKFAALSIEELRTLTTKLECIIRKGGLKALEEKAEPKNSVTDYSGIIELAKINSNKYRS